MGYQNRTAQVRYYGGKEKLLDFIETEIQSLDLPTGSTFCDLFSGTAVVGRRFKQLGYSVTANDHLVFAKCLATTRVKLNSRPRFKGLKVDPIDFLNSLPGSSGFFSRSYSPDGPQKRKYFTSENARRIDAIRGQIYQWKSNSQITKDENDFLISSLLEAMNRNSNVSGTYAAFLKSWDSRALKPLLISEPLMTPGSGSHHAYNKDALELVRTLKCDVIYLDPPYNSRQYSSNYFLLDVVAEGWFGVEPEVRGITGMRNNAHLRSDFCSKKTALSALRNIVASANAKYVVLSYNNEGTISHSDIYELMSTYGVIRTAEFKHRRYRAINHDPTQTSTIEYLFILRKTDRNG